MKTVLLGDNINVVKSVYDNETIQYLSKNSDLYPRIITSKNLNEHLNNVIDAECFFGTWSFPTLSKDSISEFKKLKVVFYAASSVKAFAKPYFENKIHISNASSVNGIFVGEYAYSQVVLALKGFFLKYSQGKHLAREGNIIGTYNSFVGVIGVGHIGRYLINKLKALNVKIYVYDPFLSADEENKLGVKKESLKNIFSFCDVISNHAPSTPETKEMITRAMLESMKPNAVFLNTGRGDIVNETELADVLNKRTDLTAVLDVTVNEPLEEDSLLRNNDNIILTPHIAGALAQEPKLMGKACVNAFIEYKNTGVLFREVTEQMLRSMT